VQVDERHPLKWPEGFGRTLIDERKDQRAWKKQTSVYIKAAMKELDLLGAKTAVITWNEDPNLAKRDPGVAIWFSMERKQDTSWQRVLQIDNPNPDRSTALDYAEIRDQRQELTTQEVDLKKKLLDLMHAKKLTEYKRNGISVKVVLEQENVKVRVKESEDDLPADIEPAPAPAVSEESVAVNSEA
jgi:hypothetical protein